MIKVLFVCHGNICRSPMGEFILKDLVTRRGIADRFEIASAATSSEEIGNAVYPPARRELEAHGISCEGKIARQMTRKDYRYYDYILCAEEYNIRNLRWIIDGDPKHKIYRVLDFTKHPRDISDPWYYGGFERTYAELLEGCQAFLRYLTKAGKL